MKNEIFFIADYFDGILKIVSLGLILTIFPIYFINNVSIGVIVYIFFTIIGYVLFNKKWIKNVFIYKLKSKIKIEYPLSVFGTRFIEVSFSEISKGTYFGYMYGTPSHCTLITGRGTLRFNSTKEKAKELSKLFESENIEFLFDDEKVVGYR